MNELRWSSCAGVDTPRHAPAVCAARFVVLLALGACAGMPEPPPASPVSNSATGGAADASTPAATTSRMPPTSQSSKQPGSENWNPEWRLVEPALPPMTKSTASPPSMLDASLPGEGDAVQGTPGADEHRASSGSPDAVDETHGLEQASTESPPSPPDLDVQSSAIPGTYTVADGDTLSQIAECFGVGVSVIAAENHLSARHNLRAGDVVRIPSSATRACEGPEKAPPPNCAPVTREESQQLAATCLYRVKAGDSVSSIAMRRRLTVDGLLNLNKCTSDDIHRGQLIRLCTTPRSLARKPAATAVAEAPKTESVPPEPVLQLPKQPVCNAYVRDARDLGGSPRAVLFANGDAVLLFEHYVKELRAKKQEPDWSALVITFVDESGTQVKLHGEPLTFSDAVLGLSDIKKWKRRLKGLKAAVRSDPRRDADALRVDLMCLPSAG